MTAECRIGIGNGTACRHHLARGSTLKPAVYIGLRLGQSVVIKDYSHARWWLKPLARAVIAREVAVLNQLESSGCVPRVIEYSGGHQFAMEYIAGVHPGKHSAVIQSDTLFQKTVHRLNIVHNAGFSHNDLRRKNIIIHPQRGPVFIDFATALRRPDGRARSMIAGLQNALVNRLQAADRHSLIRMKVFLSDTPLNDAEKAIVGRARPFHHVTRIWKLLLRRPFRPVIGSGKFQDRGLINQRQAAPGSLPVSASRSGSC